MSDWVSDWYEYSVEKYTDGVIILGISDQPNQWELFTNKMMSPVRTQQTAWLNKDGGEMGLCSCCYVNTLFKSDDSFWIRALISLRGSDLDES